MNKFNKKGFTLIEMLVVIAIIAVLVSIVIPVVGDSTAKARAATDAANLRSAKATITIGVMEGKITEGTAQTDMKGYGTAPTAQTPGVGAFKFDVAAGTKQVTVYFGSNKIEHFQKIAGGDTSATVATEPKT